MADIVVDKVIVELEAKLREYDRDVTNSEKGFDRAMKSKEKAAQRAEKTVTDSANREAKATEDAARRAAKAQEREAARAETARTAAAARGLRAREAQEKADARRATNQARQRALTIQYTINDVIASAASGGNPLTILAQQGGQVVDGFGGVTKTLGALRGALFSVGGVITAVTAALLGGVIAADRFDAQNKDLENTVTGLGRTAGVTVEQLKALADANNEAGNVSQRAAEKQAQAYLSTGRIGAEVTAGLITITDDFARVMGVKTPEAMKILAESFADPAKGAQMLQDQFGLLDVKTMTLIQTLAASGRTAEAQKLLFDALSDAIDGQANKVSGLTAFWRGLKNGISDATTAMREFFVVDEERKARRYSEAFGYDPRVGQYDAAAAARTSAAATAARDRRGTEAQTEIDRATGDDRRRDLRGRIDKIRAAVKDGTVDPAGADKAIKELEKDIAKIGAGPKGPDAAKAAERTRQEGLRREERYADALLATKRAQLDMEIAAETDITKRLALEGQRLQMIGEARDIELDRMVQQKELTKVQAEAIKKAEAELRARQDEELDRKASMALLESAVSQQRAMGAISDEIYSINAAMAKTFFERHEIEKRALARRQKQERDELEAEIELRGMGESDAAARRAGLADLQQAQRDGLDDTARDHLKGQILEAFSAAEGGAAGLAQYFGNKLKMHILEGLAEQLASIILGLPKPGGAAGGGNLLSSIAGVAGGFLGLGGQPSSGGGVGQMLNAIFGVKSPIPTGTPPINPETLLPGRKAGGDVVGGVPYYVHQDEVFVPPVSGKMVKNSALQGGRRGSTVIQPIFQNFDGAVVTEKLLAQANANAEMAAQKAGRQAYSRAVRDAPAAMSRQTAERG